MNTSSQESKSCRPALTCAPCLESMLPNPQPISAPLIPSSPPSSYQGLGLGGGGCSTSTSLPPGRGHGAQRGHFCVIKREFPGVNPHVSCGARARCIHASAPKAGKEVTNNEKIQHTMSRCRSLVWRRRKNDGKGPRHRFARDSSPRTTKGKAHARR